MGVSHLAVSTGEQLWFRSLQNCMVQGMAIKSEPILLPTPGTVVVHTVWRGGDHTISVPLSATNWRWGQLRREPSALLWNTDGNALGQVQP